MGKTFSIKDSRKRKIFQNENFRCSISGPLRLALLDIKGVIPIRAKKNMKFRRLYSQKVDKSNGVLCDQIIRVSVFYAQKDYPRQNAKSKMS